MILACDTGRKTFLYDNVVFFFTFSSLCVLAEKYNVLEQLIKKEAGYEIIISIGIDCYFLFFRS
ncbi:MAG: hypothetical protein D3906_06265 [Candidatus Electrothrix sp. AUS1_2]|nr:hypothetical protein [Candidatus Electrothrix sp. AUS1_2]